MVQIKNSEDLKVYLSNLDKQLTDILRLPGFSNSTELRAYLQSALFNIEIALFHTDDFGAVYLKTYVNK